MPSPIEWDDPEDFPEDDDDDDVHPGDPPETSMGIDLTIPCELGAGTFKVDEDRRAAIRERRRKGIADLIATKSYRNERKQVLREQYDGRFS